MRWAVVVVLVAACGRIAFDQRADSNEDSDGAPVARCDDAVENGDETGIDCGGSCTALCPNDTCVNDAECVTGRCGSAGVCELVDLGWRPGPSLTLERWRHECVTHSDGTVVVVGGVTLDGVSASVEVLAPNANAFASGPALLTAREGFGLAVLADDTLIAAVGGDGGMMNELTTERLRASSSSWELVAPSPNAERFIRAATGADGKVYLPDVTYTGVYDPGTDSWSTVDGVGRDSYAFVANSDGTVLFAFGGLTPTGGSMAVDAFDVATQVWRPLDPLPEILEEAAAVLGADRRVYITGGLRAGNSLATVAAYVPERDAHLTLPSLSSPRRWPCATLAADGRVFVIGGYDTGTILTTSELYGPAFSLSPASATPGTTVSVTGDGFAPDAIVSIVVDDVLVANSATTSSGDLAASFVVPASTSSGDHRVVVTDRRAQYPVTMVLAVP